MVKLYNYKAKVTKVIDGDTIDCDIDLGFNVHIFERFRLDGIDTPELTGADKEKGKEAKNIVTKELLNKEIAIETDKPLKTDKYGRWVATVYLDGVNYNETLLERGLAKKYGS
ncbi:thermonuclease precursor [Methanobrevibacter cuticularis]|uniref:Thermonuclease n=1 Tax=Methanobrevibacter cuticularis TaxID=47311 RepID=A0A166DSP6_9EURY|nr:thermonuclease family protein [Methanobrevibacter cuticularis]KZX15912.1 thermonuclease precursor [Methanobrevibacter cuticularis]